MSQTWLGSIAEMKANLAFGYALNFCINLVVLPWLYDPAHVALSAFYIGLVFTVASVLRQLAIRRWANTWHWGHTYRAPPPEENSDDVIAPTIGREHAP